MHTVMLTPAEWQAIINMLAEQPFKVSAPLIMAIQNQIVAQQQADAQAQQAKVERQE